MFCGPSTAVVGLASTKHTVYSGLTQAIKGQTTMKTLVSSIRERKSEVQRDVFNMVKIYSDAQVSALPVPRIPHHQLL